VVSAFHLKQIPRGVTFVDLCFFAIALYFLGGCWPSRKLISLTVRSISLKVGVLKKTNLLDGWTI
jgi:hypothetical protein